MRSLAKNDLIEIVSADGSASPVVAQHLMDVLSQCDLDSRKRGEHLVIEISSVRYTAKITEVDA